MRFVSLIFLVFIFLQSIVAQVSYDGKVGSGIRFRTKDNSFYLKYRTRIQTRWDFENIPDSNLYQNHAFVKRARLKFDG